MGATGTVTCNLGTIANGGTATVTIVLSEGCVTMDTLLTNTATVSSPTPDPNSGNNSDTETTTLLLDPSGCLG